MARVPKAARRTRQQRILELKRKQEALEREEFVASDHQLSKLRRAAKWLDDLAVTFGSTDLVRASEITVREYERLGQHRWDAHNAQAKMFEGLEHAADPITNPDVKSRIVEAEDGGLGDSVDLVDAE